MPGIPAAGIATATAPTPPEIRAAVMAAGVAEAIEMTLTAQHLQAAGVVILALVAIAILWWLIRSAVARPKRGQVAYWLQDQDDDDEDDVEGEDADAGIHGP
jgi:hypothetical protein